MRTTVRLDDDLLAQAKREAADTGRTLTAVLEDALRESLARRASPAKAKSIRLKTFKGEGVRAGVDLDDNASLLNLMDS
ncbi:MAG: ribbon-helix-helix protein, CopG family [Betaproteobacteria bacterium]|nr:ribbon-helix-helix protein, CopG family [Betaproteobacteria bacterium]